MAGGGGFEPPHTDPESAVLPLDDPPKPWPASRQARRDCIRTQAMAANQAVLQQRAVGALLAAPAGGCAQPAITGHPERSEGSGAGRPRPRSESLHYRFVRHPIPRFFAALRMTGGQPRLSTGSATFLQNVGRGLQTPTGISREGLKTLAYIGFGALTKGSDTEIIMLAASVGSRRSIPSALVQNPMTLIGGAFFALNAFTASSTVAIINFRP